MNASDAFKAGQLGAAVDAQLAAVKAHPADGARRLFLFELLLFAGDLDRAAKQGELVKFGDLETDATMMAYRKLIEAERQRRAVLRDGATPQTFGPFPDSLKPRLQALQQLRVGDKAAAMATLSASPAPAVRGTLNGTAFVGLADYDEVLAPVLEVITAGGYYWVPFEQIVRLSTNPPKYPRDLYWLPATLELADSEGPVFLPALYTFSYDHADDAVKLGRSTDWSEADDEPMRGSGQKTLLAGEQPVALLELRELEVAPND